MVQSRCKILAAVFILLLFSSAKVPAAEIQKPERIRIGYSSISGSRISLWTAQDRGFFARQGLQSELVVLSGILGIQSLIAGEIQFFLGATDSTAQFAAQGSHVILIATAERIEQEGVGARR